MQIRLAIANDLDPVLAIVAETVAQMRREGSDQWDATYPDRDRFQQDLNHQSLYIVHQGGQVLGFMVLDRQEPAEYGPLPWQLQDCLVLHRFAIAQTHRRQGIASRLEAFACRLAQQQKVKGIKTDTYSANRAMQSFFKRRGYQPVGSMRFMGKARPFWGYEKIF